MDCRLLHVIPACTGTAIAQQMAPVVIYELCDKVEIRKTQTTWGRWAFKGRVEIESFCVLNNFENIPLVIFSQDNAMDA